MKPAYIVTGMGRSGTMWLARVLNEDPSIACGHERFGADDARYFELVLRGKADARQYLTQRLQKMTAVRKKNHPDQAWGEVNSYLRYMAPEMREVFGCPVVGLVRDGRYVVRSLMKRGVFQRKGYPSIAAPQGLETPFEKCCWYWADSYRLLLDQNVPVYKLEGLNSDWCYFQLLTDELGTTIGERAWRRRAGKRIHVSVESTKPPDWTVVQDETFGRLAGDIQAAFDYEVPG